MVRGKAITGGYEILLMAGGILAVRLYPHVMRLFGTNDLPATANVLCLDCSNQHRERLSAAIDKPVQQETPNLPTVFGKTIGLRYPICGIVPGLWKDQQDPRARLQPPMSFIES